MNLYILCIWDNALLAYSNPIYAPSIGIAIRSFGDEINNPESVMYKHPADYTLHKMGTFDSNTGHFFIDPSPSQVARGADYDQRHTNGA